MECSSQWPHCYEPDSAECKPIGKKHGLGDDDYQEKILREFAGVLRVSNRSMSWWAAENWCKALGKDLISMDVFHCDYSPMIDGSEVTWGCCLREDESCSDYWYGYWDWRSDIKPEHEAVLRPNYSSQLIALREAVGVRFERLWTSTYHDFDSSSTIHIGWGVKCANSRSEHYPALCK